MASKEVEFNVVIAEVADARQEEASDTFAQAFGLDPTVAQQILKSAPIVFLTNASKAEVKALTPRLIEVSKAGIEFRITARPASRVPKVNWPMRPQFAVGAGPANGGQSATFNLQNNAFVCPSCGETFLFRTVGRLPLGEAPAEGSSASLAVPAPAAAPARPAPAAPPPKSGPSRSAGPVVSAAKPAPAPKPAVKRAPAPPPPPAEEPLELLDEPPGVGEEPAPEAAPELEAEPAAESAGEPAEQAAAPEGELLPDEPAAAPAGGDEILDAPLEADLVEPAAEQEDVSAPPPRPAAAQETAKMMAPEEEPSLAEEAAPDQPAAPPAAASGETYNVFLSKIASNDKKEQAAKLISEMKGCPIEEARELAGRLIIPLLRDAPRSEAEAALNKFKSIKITGRMTLSKKK